MKRIFSAVLLFVFIAGLLFVPVKNSSLDVSAAKSEKDTIVVIAGSDFQSHDGVDGGIKNMTNIISAMKDDGYTSANGFLFGGDYGNDNATRNSEISAIKGSLKKEYPMMSEGDMLFCQGNHDFSNSVGLAKTGGHDTAHYGVYLINEDDYPTSADEAKVKATAEKLGEYLAKKEKANYKKPIFIISHLPLHFSVRKDNLHSQTLFNTINNFAGAGLNIIYLFGHNHSSEYDNYVGGSLIYFEPGDKIYIPRKGEATDPQYYYLNFTYMNAGYVGFSNCLHKSLSMSVFEIDGENVKIERYTSGGMYLLKGKGEWYAEKGETAAMYEGAGQEYLNIAYASPRAIGNFELPKNNQAGSYEEILENNAGDISITPTQSTVTSTTSSATTSKPITSQTSGSSSTISTVTENKVYEESVKLENQGFSLSLPIIIAIVAGTVVILAAIVIVLILVLKKKPIDNIEKNTETGEN